MGYYVLVNGHPTPAITRNTLGRGVNKLVRIIKGFLSKARVRYLGMRLSSVHGLIVSPGVQFHGKPILKISEGAQISIGAGSNINSRNRGYHVNMHSPVKLMADKPGATITIGERTRIHGTCIHAYSSVTIGDRCLIAANCQIIDGNGHELSFDDVENRINTKSDGRPIVIEDCVWLGANTIVLPGVKIGRGSVVRAGSVVAEDIPPMVVAGGNPAKTIDTSEQILRRKRPATDAG